VTGDALDPRAAEVLAELAAAGRPPVWEQRLDDARRAYRELLLVPDPPAVAAVADASAPGPGGPVPLRVYTPEGGGPRPVVVYMHGGGWVMGDLDSHDAVCRLLARGSGSVVVAVGYRLAPEHPFPAGLQDALAATAWAHENAAALGGAPGPVAVAGDSSGGNLAAAVALVARDAGGPPIAFQLLAYPPMDPSCDTASHRRYATGYRLTSQAMRWYWSRYLSGPVGAGDPRATPLTAPDLRGLPPALVVTAGCDPLRDEAEAYARRLADAGVPVEIVRWPGQIHGFFGAEVFSTRGAEAAEAAGRALAAALG
jgi:acetyl esterase